jgi:uncharacterized protein (TIGR00255 family)
MTGFGRSSNRVGRSSAKSHALALDVSVRAVNGRYLEMRFHSPREYAALETEFKNIITKVFSRGTLDIYINRVHVQNAENKVSVNVELAKSWYNGYRSLQKALNLKTEPSLEMIARIPDVMQTKDVSAVSDQEKKQVKALLKEAVEACDQERQREGASLKTELVQLCHRLESISRQMEKLKHEAQGELENRYRERMNDGLQKLGFGQKLDEQRIAQELVMQLDRGDIDEELMRLKEHLKAYQQLLTGPESQGKKLDFYAQELLREVNTIGSKSHIAKLTSLVVEAKTIVEKVREQVQNAE